jgi:hypothetical protein
MSCDAETADGRQAPPPVSPLEARELTERIRTALEDVCLLLMEAHTRRVWIPLGYRSWSEYVQIELAMSRSRSYELLNHARLVQAIQAEAGISQAPSISTYAAGLLRPHLAEIILAIRERVATLPEEQATAAVQEIVEEARARAAQRRAREEPSGADSLDHAPARAECPLSQNISRLRTAIQWLANMPPPGVVLTRIPEADVHRLARLLPARRRLMDLASRWSDGLPC